MINRDLFANPFDDSLALGRRLRDEGIRRVTAAEPKEWSLQFMDYAEAFLDNLPRGGEFTGETIRLYVTGKNLPDPHHPNCWSANLRGCIVRWIKAGRVSIAGVAQAHVPTSHARLMRRYRKVT